MYKIICIFVMQFTNMKILNPSSVSLPKGKFFTKWTAFDTVDGIFMKKIKLSQGFFALVDDNDFEMLSKHKWFIKKLTNTNYATANININGKRKTQSMHRLIMNPPSNLGIDHINHNGLDNRKENLRFATQQQNTMNRTPNKNAVSKYKGVTWNSRSEKWSSKISINGKSKSLGYYFSEEAAADAYNAAAEIYYKEFANLNHIP